MRLNTRSRYGLRAMVEIARDEKPQVTAESLARTTSISKKYLDSILQRLREAGLLSASRGAKGGYSLARPASEINVAEVLELLENEISLVPCVDDANSCNRSADCLTRPVWRAATRAIRDVLSSLTLRQLVNKPKDTASMYHI